jgi:hypothetical protein
LPLSGLIDNSGIIALNSTGDATELQIVGDGLTLQGGGQIVMSDSEMNFIVGSSSASVLTNVDNTISGAGQIGLGDGTLTLINQTQATIVANLPGGILTIDTGHTVVNNGVLEAANGGTLQIDDPVIGNGAALVAGGTLAFEQQSSINVIFDNGQAGTNYGELVLGNPCNFSGHVIGFSGTAPDAAHSDAIDLVGMDYGSCTFSEAHNGSTDVLTVSDGSNVAKLTFDNFNSALFFSSDGHGGTLVTDPPADAGVNPAASVSLGGAGNDNFVFHPGTGAETIANFNPQQDTIELNHFTDVQTVQELQSLIANDAHGNAMIDLGHHDSITLTGVTTSELQQVIQAGHVLLH